MSAVDIIITPRQRDIGGFEVARVLPYMKRRSVGPFVFFDHMGPANFAPGNGIDVRPHPHIGLATVTYLFDGEIMHRDSVGSVQAIRPGDVNWMVAGRGIVHSERTDMKLRAAGHRLHGIQSWVALPKGAEQDAPSFAHHAAATLPTTESNGARLRIIAGTGFALRSPVKVATETLYVSADLATGAQIVLDTEHTERAVYVVEGAITINGEPIAGGSMAVLVEDVEATIVATQTSRLMILGGAPLDGPRHLWWNFVASDQALLDQAKADWSGGASNGWAGRFTLPPGELEYIPLPES